MPTPSRHRSAKTGKFVTAKKARKAPNTTVKEKVRKWSTVKIREILIRLDLGIIDVNEAYDGLKQLLHK